MLEAFNLKSKYSKPRDNSSNELTKLAQELQYDNIKYTKSQIADIVFSPDKTHRATIYTTTDEKYKIRHEQLFLHSLKEKLHGLSKNKDSLKSLSKQAIIEKATRRGVWRLYKDDNFQAVFDTLEEAKAAVLKNNFFIMGPHDELYCPLMNDWIQEELCQDMKVVNDGVKKSRGSKKNFDNGYINTVCSGCNRKSI